MSVFVRLSPVPVVTAFALALAAPAYGDIVAPAKSNVSSKSDTVAQQSELLRVSKRQKTRLAAAVSLAQTRDDRAAPALILALDRDPAAVVRQIAAAGLGKVVTSYTPAELRMRALASLDYAAKHDAHTSVRTMAARALDSLLAAPAASSGSVVIAVAEPSAAAPYVADTLTDALHQAMSQAVKRRAPAYIVHDERSKWPTHAQLRRHSLRGYKLHSTVAAFDITGDGTDVTVSCSLAVEVSPWKGRDTEQHWRAGEVAWTTGTGEVTVPVTATEPKPEKTNEIEKAKRECLLTVAKELTERRVLPFITAQESDRLRAESIAASKQ